MMGLAGELGWCDGVGDGFLVFWEGRGGGVVGNGGLDRFMHE